MSALGLALGDALVCCEGSWVQNVDAARRLVAVFNDAFERNLRRAGGALAEAESFALGGNWFEAGEAEGHFVSSWYELVTTKQLPNLGGCEDFNLGCRGWPRVDEGHIVTVVDEYAVLACESVGTLGTCPAGRDDYHVWGFDAGHGFVVMVR